MSRRPSPSRLKQNTAIISARPGKQRDPPFAGHHEAGAFRDHDAPFGGWRAHPEPDEGQPGGIEDRVAHGQRHLHDHDRHDVGQDVHQQDAELAIARQPRRLHEARLAPHICLGAGDARIERKVHDRGGDDDVLHGVSEGRDDAHRQHEQRKRHDGIGDAADDAVGPAAEITGGNAGKPAHQEYQRHRRHRDEGIEPGCHDDAAENIAAELIGAEPVRRRRRFQGRRSIRRQRIVGNDVRPEQRREYDEDQ